MFMTTLLLVVALLCHDSRALASSQEGELETGYRPPTPTSDCSEDQLDFYRDVFSQTWLSRIVVIGKPFEASSSSNQEGFFLRINIDRVLKGTPKDLLFLNNLRKRIPVFVRVSHNDSDTFVDQRCAELRANANTNANSSFNVPTSASDLVKLGEQYYFFLDATNDPLQYKPLFTPAKRKRSIEDGIAYIGACNSSCNAAPRLTDPARQVIGQVGEAVTVSCETADFMMTKMQWFRQLNNSGQEEWVSVQPQAGSTFSVSVSRSGKKKSDLTINPLDYGHSGVYRCDARNLLGQSSAYVSLRVLSAVDMQKYATVVKTTTTPRLTQPARDAVSSSSAIVLATTQIGARFTQEAEAEDEEEDEDDAPPALSRNCTDSGLECKNGALCRRNAQRQFECWCESGLCANVSSIRSSSTSVFTSVSTAKYTLWTFGSTPLTILASDRHIWSSVELRYSLAIGSILLLVVAISIAILYVCRLRRHKRLEQSKFVQAQGQGAEALGQAQVDTTVNTTCTTSLSTTNSSGSACGSTSSSSAASQKSANCATLSPRHANSSHYASANQSQLSSVGAVSKGPVQFDFEDDDAKSPTSDTELCIGGAPPRRSAYKRPDSKVRLQPVVAFVQPHETRDVYVSLSMPADARSLSSQALSSALARHTSDSQRMAQSRSLHMLPPRSTGRLWPVQEIPSDQDDQEGERLHASTQTCSLDRRRLLRGRSEDEDQRLLHAPHPVTPKSPSQFSSRSCGGVIRNPSACHRRTQNVFLTDEIQIDDDRPLQSNSMFTNPSTYTVHRPY